MGTYQVNSKELAEAILEAVLWVEGDFTLAAFDRAIRVVRKKIKKKLTDPRKETV